MRKRIRRNIEWFLCTDFDAHEPMPRDTMKAILFLIVLVLIIGGIQS